MQERAVFRKCTTLHSTPREVREMRRDQGKNADFVIGIVILAKAISDNDDDKTLFYDNYTTHNDTSLFFTDKLNF